MSHWLPISRTIPYTKLAHSAALELSFGNGAFSLVVVLPDENMDISEVVEQIDGAWWKQVITGLEVHTKFFEVNLAIPRFEMAYERNLKNDLIALGMRTPFDSKTADFSFMSNQNGLFVSYVKQITFAQMDEDGMKTAAATVIEWVSSGDMQNEFERVDFIVNRPFLYFIKEKSTNLIFFAGIMNKIS